MRSGEMRSKEGPLDINGDHLLIHPCFISEETDSERISDLPVVTQMQTQD